MSCDVWNIMQPHIQHAIMRPGSGLSVLLALRHVPRTTDVADMIERIDAIDGYPRWIERKLNGASNERA